jgi:uncharacterized protein YjbK
MTSPIESELKLMVSEDGWRSVLAWAEREGALQSQAEQTNHYFDVPGLGLAADLSMIRLREKSGAWTMTFKKKIDRPDQPGQHSIEIECAVDAPTAQALLSAPQTLASNPLPPAARLREEAASLGLDLSQLSVIGDMITLRAKIRSPSGRYVLEVDHSRYCGTEDHEIECEAEDLHPARDEILALLASLGVDYDASPAPKFARMIAAAGLS